MILGLILVCFYAPFVWLYTIHINYTSYNYMSYHMTCICPGASCTKLTCLYTTKLCTQLLTQMFGCTKIDLMWGICTGVQIKWSLPQECEKSCLCLDRYIWFFGRYTVCMYVTQILLHEATDYKPSFTSAQHTMWYEANLWHWPHNQHSRM